MDSQPPEDMSRDIGDIECLSLVLLSHTLSTRPFGAFFVLKEMDWSPPFAGEESILHAMQAVASLYPHI